MDKFITQCFSLLVLTAPALVLIVRQGINVSAVILLLLSLIILVSKRQINIALNNKEKILIFSLLLLPIVIIFDVTLRGIDVRHLDYYLRFILVIPIFFALRKTPVNLIHLIIGILIGAMGAGLFALYQKFYLNDFIARGHTVRINFGNLSLLLGMMSLAGLFIANDIRFKKIFYVATIFAFILGMTGSLLSGARGGWVAMPFFIGLFIFYFPANKKYKLISGLIVLLTIMSIYYSNGYIKTRVNSAYVNTAAYFNISDSNVTKTSSGIRLELWKAAWMMVAEHPFLGIGSGRFEQGLKEKIAAGEINKIELYEHVHNESLQILVMTGIVGFLAYIILYAGMTYFFYISLASDTNWIRYVSFLGLMTVGAYFIFGLTNYSFGHHVMILFFALMVAIFAGIIKNLEDELEQPINNIM